MAKQKKDEVVPGLSTADTKKIADQILNRNDGNHPEKEGIGFLGILEKGKPSISASSIFIKKVSL